MNVTIINPNASAVIINGAAEGFMSAYCKKAWYAAEHIKDAYPNLPRYIDITTDAVGGVDAAFKTASGLYSAKRHIIARSIYKMSKIEVALAIVEHDKSRPAIDRAAFEVARDVFISGKVEEHAQALAKATGESREACLELIKSKLARMSANLAAKIDKCELPGEAAHSPELIKDVILRNGGRYLIQLPTGEGKTSRINEPVLQRYISQGKKVLVISHRRSINASLAHIDGMVSYADCNHPRVIASARGLKIVVNSLAQQKYKRFLQDIDLVVIDEVSQVIAHVFGGEVKGRETVWETLNFVVKSARNVIFTDADINSRCVELIGDGARFFKKEQDHSDVLVKTGGADQVRGMIIAAALAGETVLVACDVAREARAIGKIIERKTGVAPLVITAENVGWPDQTAFIANPNLTTYQVVLYSPVITSALSITSQHFSRHFGIFCGQVVPSDAIQMLRRSRKARQLVVGLRNPVYRKTEQVELQFRRELIKLTEAMSVMGLSENDKAKLIEAVEIDTKPGAFTVAQYNHCSAEAWLKDNIQNTLPGVLIVQGFKIEVLEHDDDLAKVGYAARFHGGRAVKRYVAGKLIASKRAEAGVVRKVKNRGSTDESEHIAVIRARAEEHLRREKLTEADAQFWVEGDGEGRVKRFAKLYNETFLSDDEKKVIRALKPALVGMLLTKGWKAQDSAAVIDQLSTIRDSVLAFGISLGKATTVRARQAAMTRILGCFGVRTRKVDGGKSGDYYVIPESSITQMIGYL